jgi:hypothetical protein
MIEAQIVDFGIKGLKTQTFYVGSSDSMEKVNDFMKDRIVYYVFIHQMMLWIFYTEEEGDTDAHQSA